MVRLSCLEFRCNLGRLQVNLNQDCATTYITVVYLDHSLKEVIIMTNHERADMLIKTIKIWQFLQHVDNLVDDGDLAAAAIVNDFFSRYNLSLTEVKNNGVLPWVQLKTNFSLLLVTLCFARNQSWDDTEMKPPSDYDLDCKLPKSPAISQVIRTIRNAAAHEFENRNSISFPEGCVASFQAKHGCRITGEVAFRTEEGFVDFLKDYIRAIQKMAIKSL